MITIVKQRSRDTRTGRGKGKRAAMVHVNVRMPASTLEFYKKYPSYTAKIREVLVKYAAQNDMDPEA